VEGIQLFSVMYNFFMPLDFFVSDLHGRLPRYKKLWEVIRLEKPDSVFLGGDLLPGMRIQPNFVQEVMISEMQSIKIDLQNRYPSVFLIPGNDDGKWIEPQLVAGEVQGLWKAIHNRHVKYQAFDIFGYAFVPPTPFLYKDWEKYDVSQFVEPGSISPEEGEHSTDVDPSEIHFGTIQADLNQLTLGIDLSNAIFLFHAPPWRTVLDRAALDGKMVDHVPLDVHIGSIAIKRFLEERQPLLSLHGLTGNWREKIGRTWAFSAAHDGNELALIRFDPDNLEDTSRELIPV
jgi:uncharacterized protein